MRAVSILLVVLFSCGRDVSGLGGGNESSNKSSISSEELRKSEAECAEGKGPGCSVAGGAYLLGERVNHKIATSFFEKGCKLEAKDSCYNLAVQVENGLGTEKDSNRAAELYEKACTLGEGLSCYTMAERIGIRNTKESGVYFEKACESNYGKGCTNAGVFYEEGRAGYSVDAIKSADFSDKGCNLGDGAGCFNLGLAYEKGRGVTKDFKRSAELYEKGCDLQFGVSCYAFAWKLYEGKGIAQDKKRAHQMREKGCSLGHKDSCFKK